MCAQHTVGRTRRRWPRRASAPKDHPHGCHIWPTPLQAPDPRYPGGHSPTPLPPRPYPLDPSGGTRTRRSELPVCRPPTPLPPRNSERGPATAGRGRHTAAPLQCSPYQQHTPHPQPPTPTMQSRVRTRPGRVACTPHASTPPCPPAARTSPHNQPTTLASRGYIRLHGCWAHVQGVAPIPAHTHPSRRSRR